MGHCLSKHGIPLFDLPGLHPEDPYQTIKLDILGHFPDRIRNYSSMDYMFPISYHYVKPAAMALMHNGCYLHGFSSRELSEAIPRIVHRGWVVQNYPDAFMNQCTEVRAPYWQPMYWNTSQMKKVLPDTMAVHDLSGGNGLNIIARFEVLMMFGGFYMEANSDCLLTNQLMELSSFSQAVVSSENASILGKIFGKRIVGSHPFSPFAVTMVSELHKLNSRGSLRASAAQATLVNILRSFENVEDKFLRISFLESIV